MSYTTLVFEPNIPEDYNPIVLWKAQTDAYANYKSINLILLNDNIEFNNRRTLSKWYELLKENNIYYEFEFDSEYAKSLIIFDGEVGFFNLQLFACDIKASNYILEVEPDYIISMLHILELNKSGVVFPTLLMNKLKRARNLIESNIDLNPNTSKPMINYFKLLEKLIDHCAHYENDIKYHIVEH